MAQSSTQVTSELALVLPWVPPAVSSAPCPTASSPGPSPAPLCVQPPSPGVPAGLCPCRPGDTRRVWAAGSQPCAVGSCCPCLSPPSCSNRVPVPRHGDSRGLPRGALTGTRTCCLQHLPGRTAAAAHPCLWRVSTRRQGHRLPRGVCLPPRVSHFAAISLALPGSCAAGRSCSSPGWPWGCEPLGLLPPWETHPLAASCAPRQGRSFQPCGLVE